MTKEEIEKTVNKILENCSAPGYGIVGDAAVEDLTDFIEKLIKGEFKEDEV